MLELSSTNHLYSSAVVRPLNSDHNSPYPQPQSGTVGTRHPEPLTARSTPPCTSAADQRALPDPFWSNVPVPGETDCMEWTKDEFVLTDDSRRLDLERTFTLLQGTYWGVRRPREVVTRSNRNVEAEDSGNG